MRRLIFLFFAFFSVAEASDSRGVVFGEFPKDLDGRIAYIDPLNAKIIEIDPNGFVQWEWSIPSALVNSGSIDEGADIEWIPLHRSYLFVVPSAGVYEVARDSGDLIWSCESKHISHDADRLKNGNTIFVDGWDQNHTPVVTEVDPSCNVVREIFAETLLVGDYEHRSGSDGSYSNTHANAIQELNNGDLLISLRNYGKFVRLSNGSVIKTWHKTHKGHDPVMKNGVIYYADHQRKGTDLRHSIVRINKKNREKIFIAPNQHDWEPLRTVQRIGDRYILITGSTMIGLISVDGNLLWSIKLSGFDYQRDDLMKAYAHSFLYKAVYIPKN